MIIDTLNTTTIRPILPIYDCEIMKKNFWQSRTNDGFMIVYFLMPNGQVIVLECNELLTLFEIKTAVFNEAKNYPLYNLMKEPKFYNYSYVTNHGTIQVIDEGEESVRKLINMRNMHKTVFKFVEAEFNDVERYIQSQISTIIGCEIMSKITALSGGEEHRFITKYKDTVRKLAMNRDVKTWDERLAIAYPPDIDFGPNLPKYLQNQLLDGKEFKVKLVLDHHQTSSILVSADDTPSIVLPKVIGIFKKKYNCTETLEEVILKVVGQNSYFCKEYDPNLHQLVEYPLIRYKYIRDSIRKYQTPKITICKKNSIKLESSQLIKQKDPPPIPQKKSKVESSHLWDLPEEEEFFIKINNVSNFNTLDKYYGIALAVFAGKEPITKIVHTELKQGPKLVFNEKVYFGLPTNVYPRMAKVCLCLYSTSKPSNKIKYAESIGWLNMSMFDFQGNLNFANIPTENNDFDNDFNEFTFSIINYDEITNGVIHKPMGAISLPVQNNDRIKINISYKNFSKSIKGPSKDDYLQLYQTLKNKDKKYLNINLGNVVSKYFDQNTNKLDNAAKRNLKAISKLHVYNSISNIHSIFLWSNWKFIKDQYPEFLVILLGSIEWTNREHIAIVYELLEKWPLMNPLSALELLGYWFTDEYVRAYAVDCVGQMSNIELECYLLQLIQALKFELYLDCALTNFLISRAVHNRRITHFIFWNLKSEMGIQEVYVRFGLLLEVICRGDFGYCQPLFRQVEFLERLEFLSSNIQRAGNLDRQTRKSLFVEFVTMATNTDVFHDVYNPLEPRYHMSSLKIEECDIKESKKKPIFLVFENMDPLGRDIKILFKYGDDLRQDILTLQTIRVMDHIWQKSGYDLKLVPYKVLASGTNTGLIEIVENSCTLGKIQLKKGFKKNTIYDWIIESKPTNMPAEAALEMFKLSCTAYSIVTLVLGIGDRHNDNIMLKQNGTLFHIDFGHFLGNYKSFMGIRRERVPFLLTTDFLFAATVGSDEVSSTKFKGFQELCEGAYMAIRRHGNHIVTLFALMINSNLPELNKSDDLNFLMNTLSLGKSKKEAISFFREKFKEAYNGRWSTYLNFYAHNKRIASSQTTSNKISGKLMADLKNDILEM